MSNARLQQLFTLALGGLGLGWVGLSLHQGLPARAVWALLLVVPQAPVLATEFVWAAMAARREGARRVLGQGTRGAAGQADAAPEPYPALWVWVWAWLQETWASLLTFGWRQPWAHAQVPDHLPAEVQGRRGVLLVHGFVCNRGFWNPWMRRLRAAGVPYVAVTMEPPFGDVSLQARALTPAWQRLIEATGMPPLLVGHSMGGLAIRAWLAEQTEDVALSHEVITIGSPHHGTALAMLAQSNAASQMRLLSPFLQELAAREGAERRARFTCYWSVCDNIVFPANTATLPGARAVAVPGRPHVALAHDPMILADVLARTTGNGGDSASAPSSPL